MKNAIAVLTVLGIGWNDVLPDAQAATIDVAAADGVFLANTIAGGDGSLANAKSGTPNTNSSPRLKLVVVNTLPYPVINSKTPGAEDIPGGFEGGNTVKVTVRGKSEYHLFAHSYQTLDWSHCQLDHWVSSDGLQWRHDQVLVPPYTDKATGLWTLSCSPMPFFGMANGRFYGSEGVACCEGTCTHVLQYEQAMGRLFPELDIVLRERADFDPDPNQPHRSEIRRPAGQILGARTATRCHPENIHRGNQHPATLRHGHPNRPPSRIDPRQGSGLECQ